MELGWVCLGSCGLDVGPILRHLLIISEDLDHCQCTIFILGDKHKTDAQSKHFLHIRH